VVTKTKVLDNVSGQSKIFLCSIVRDTINFEVKVLMKCSLHVQVRASLWSNCIPKKSGSSLPMGTVCPYVRS